MIFEFVSQQISIFALVVSTLSLCTTSIWRISMFAYVGDTSIYDSKTSSRHFPLMMMLSVKRSLWTICVLTKILVIKYWKFSFSTLLGTFLSPLRRSLLSYAWKGNILLKECCSCVHLQPLLEPRWSFFFSMRTNSSSSGTQTHGKKGELQDCFFRISRVSPLESAPSSTWFSPFCLLLLQSVVCVCELN